MTISTSRDPGELIRSTAASLGFEVCQFTSVTEPWPAGDALRAFVADGRHGTMAWMQSTLERRAHPQAMWAQARSAVVVGMNYGPDHDPLAILAEPSRAAISVYAQGRDYHAVIKGRLKTLAGVIHRRLGGEVKVFVDTAPLMEKPLAALAGVGWQGKHTNLVSREFGSWLFLGVVLTTLDLVSAGAADDACGSCRACLDICPTDALRTAYRIDAQACISYLTIEHAGPIPERYRKALGNASMDVTTVSRCARGTSSPPPPAKPNSTPGRRCALRPWPIWPLWTRPDFALCSPQARSSASAAIALCAMCFTPSATPAIRP